MHVAKPWGYEIIWAHTAHYIGKILHIRKGERLSLQHHEQKEESLYLHTGKVLIMLEDPQGIFQEYTLIPTQHIHIPAGAKHRITAQEDSDIFEVSTAHLEDVIRHEDDYGRI
jgi:mannose-6-phosphate isomerase-like protein (cupin superfamily)